MTEQVKNQPDVTETNQSVDAGENKDSRRRKIVFQSLALLAVFVIGIVGGTLVGNHFMLRDEAAGTNPTSEPAMALMDQVNPGDGYTIPAVLGSLGSKLVAAGAIDVPRFIDLYQQQNRPLSDQQMAVLTGTSQDQLVIGTDNANFLLNFFWAFGLTNANPILTTGPMVTNGLDKAGTFASTGGWTLGEKQPMELYASRELVRLTDEQQARLLEVASGVYRPCCNNPTHFPDCNHGMAMLGLLELMASQDATTDQMFEAAKYVNAFWYPQQMLEIAIAYKMAHKVDFALADARQVVSSQYSSGSGFQSVHQWLSQNGLLPQAPGSGGSCGVQ